LLNFGVLIERPPRAWQASCVSSLQQSGLAELQCLIQRGEEAVAPEQQRTFKRFLDDLHLDCLQPVDLTAMATRNQHVLARRWDLDKESTTRLPAEGLDFILSFCNRDVSLRLANLVRLDVWYFALSDVTAFESHAPAFWEIFHGHNVMGAYLLKVEGVDSQGRPLRHGYFATNHQSYAASLETVLDSITDWPRLVCRAHAAGLTSSLGAKPLPRTKMQYGFPNELQVQALKTMMAKSQKALRRLNQFYRVDWNVAELKGSAVSVVRDQIADVKVICPYRRGRYLADPSLFIRNGRKFVLCEQYLYRKNKGTIAAFEIVRGRAQNLKVVVEEPFHLSYPQIIEHEGRLYCLPESAEARKVLAYEADEFPWSWKRPRVLIDDVAAVDSTLLYHDGMWWLFFTDGERKRYNTALHIWYSNNLFGEWKPHVLNPVKVDVRSARDAGPLFREGGRLYRPAQDCSRTYGGRLRINEILRLSKTDYEETVAATIEPPRGKYNDGIHTLSVAGGTYVVDVKRYSYNPMGAVSLLLSSAKRVALRLGVSESVLARAKNRLGLG
jgi:hypothetical protein